MATEGTGPVGGLRRDAADTRLKAALCLERFDFGRAARMMAAVGWRYHQEAASPTPDRLRQTAADLLAAAAEGATAGGTGYSAARSGLVTAAWAWDDTAGRWWPSLEFVGEAAEVTPDELDGLGLGGVKPVLEGRT